MIAHELHSAGLKWAGVHHKNLTKEECSQTATAYRLNSGSKLYKLKCAFPTYRKHYQQALQVATIQLFPQILPEQGTE